MPVEANFLIYVLYFLKEGIPLKKNISFTHPPPEGISRIDRGHAGGSGNFACCGRNFFFFNFIE